MEPHVLGTCETLPFVVVAFHRGHLAKKRFLNQVELIVFEKL